MLTTYGGDPHAGFRIARCLRHHFKRLTVYVPDYCKSAGTLICIAADELVIDDRGELGPLDVQVKKANEILENSSGLEVSEALNFLQTRAEADTRALLLRLRRHLGLSTKMASAMAAEIVTGLLSEIYAQIDPLKIGELQRAIRIAFEYGDRLNSYTSNLKPDALGTLVTGYPSHSFVIDRKEAASLFKKVRQPNAVEQGLKSIIRDAGLLNPGAAQKVQLVKYQTIQELLAERGVTHNGERSGAAESADQHQELSAETAKS